jgi:hypothetical protein
MAKDRYKFKRDKSNMAPGCNVPGYKPKRNKKRSKTNINTEKVKYITPICPLGGKCIQPPGEDGYNPANCKKCSKMIEGLSW